MFSRTLVNLALKLRIDIADKDVGHLNLILISMISIYCIASSP